MSTVIIFNPHSGRRQAQRRLNSLPLDKLGAHELWPTSRPEHAEELALAACDQGFSTVVAAGGDGTVHEVANGILRSGRDAALGIIPIGSANDYFYSVEKDLPVGQDRLRVDVGQVREPRGKERFFVCCLGLGFNGAVTLEARKIRGLQGVPLYSLATLRALMRHYGTRALSVTRDGGATAAKPTLMMSVMVGRREGGFVMAPHASLVDGLFDYVHAGRLSRWEVLRLLPRIALFGAPDKYPQVEIGQCKSLRLSAGKSLIAHIDGEFFCRPKDDIRDLEIDLLPARLTVRRLPF